MLFQQEGTTRQSWAKRGKGFIVQKHPGKHKSKFFGAISIEESPSLIYQKANWFNGKTFKQFLEYLLTKFKKVFLILDNVKYHKARILKPFLEENKNRIWLHYLPPYSPELNAIEIVWRETKKDATHNRYFPYMRGLTRSVQTQFRIYQNDPSRLSSLIDNFL